MTSPRLSEPDILKDVRDTVQDSTAADMWNTLAPVAAEVGQRVVVDKYESTALSSINTQAQADLERTRSQAAATSAQMDTVAVAGEKVVSQYARDISRMENAVAQGVLGADAAKLRVNAITRDYARRFPAFASEFTSRNSGMEAVVDQVYSENREFQLAERKAKEIGAARDRMIALSINPDDAAAVDQYMKLETRGRQNAMEKALLEQKIAKTAEDDARLLETIENDAVLRATSFLGEALALFAKITPSTNDPNRVTALRTLKYNLSVKRLQLINQVTQATKGSPDSQRILTNLNDMFNTVEKATDFNQVAQLYDNMRSTLEDEAVIGVYVPLSRRERASIVLGDSFEQFFQRTVNLEGNRGNLIGVMGQEGYEAAVASQRRIAQAFYGGKNPTRRQTNDANQQAVVDAADPKAPTTPVNALAGREMILNLAADSNIPDTAIQAAYEKTLGLDPGERLSLAALAARPRVLHAVSGSRVFQAQLRSEVIRMNTDLAEFENVRLYYPNSADRENWVLKDRNRVLISRDPFIINNGMLATTLRMPAPDTVRDTINALITLQDQGVDTGPAVNNMFKRWNPVINPVTPEQPPNEPRQ